MRHVALLRGVNVGGRTVKMTELKSCFESMNFENVVTVLQSGNVVFDAEEAGTEVLKSRIEAGLTDQFHYPAKVQVIPVIRLKQIIADCPFVEVDSNFHRYVIFFEDGLESKLVEEVQAIDQTNQVVAGNGVVYWRCPKGQTLDNPLGKLLEKPTYRQFHTNRNLNTLEKLISK